MLFLPHSTDLKLAQRPYVTYAVILICLFIHTLQEQSREKVNQAANHYCELVHYDNDGRSIHGLVDLVPRLERPGLDYLRSDTARCSIDLGNWHTQPNKENIRRFLERRFGSLVRSDVEKFLAQLTDEESPKVELSEEELALVIEQAQAHYRAFQIYAPVSMDQRLMYDPATLNPVRMVSSSLAHGDWGHIIFNLIFFFAFAPALEVMCLHWLRYVAVLVSISVATCVSYSLFSAGSIPIPSLGLSGVVMGMMGLSAYMMPWARIRTFVWFFTFAKNIYIPAWILAGFYIGSDIITLFESGNSGGINVVAHVSGGISGYLIGRFWLKTQKEEVKQDLEEEMEQRRAMRDDVMRSGTTSRAGQHRRVEQRREFDAKREHQAWMDRLHTLVSTSQDSEAVALLMGRYDDYLHQPGLYDELFEELLKWRHGRTALCLGRLNITLLIKAGKIARALQVIKQCQALSMAFVLADPEQNAPLLKEALARGEYELAYGLLHNAYERYGDAVDVPRFRLLEAQLLIQHLKRYDEARQLLGTILAQNGGPYRAQAQKLADLIAQLA